MNMKNMHMQFTIFIYFHTTLMFVSCWKGGGLARGRAGQIANAWNNMYGEAITCSNEDILKMGY